MTARFEAEAWTYSGRNYRFVYESAKNHATLFTPGGQRLLSFPVEARLLLGKDEVYFDSPEVTAAEAGLTLRRQSPHAALAEIRLVFTFHPDCFVAAFEADAGAEVAVNSLIYFQQGTHGLFMVDSLRAFSPTTVIEGFYESFKPRVDAFSLSVPPALNIAVGNPHGLVGFGLADLPDSMAFGLTDEYALLAEDTGGNKKIAAGATYAAPRLLVTFPDEEWNSLAVFRQALIEHGFYQPPAPRQRPAWWNKPILCTYGDTILELQYNAYATEDWDSPGFNSAWLRQWIDDAERRLGLTDFTIIVDVFWQRRFSADPSPDPVRFPDLRQIIDECHARGHKVLLWYGPFLDKLDLGIEPASKKFGVLTDSPAGFDNLYAIDFTHPNAPAYLAHVAQKMFGSGEGELNADGLKMDFLCWVRRPTAATYAQPELGMGIRELYLFYDLFAKEAAKVKPDALLEASTSEPRFEGVAHLNRLHDTHYYWYEREMRARISSLAAPNLLIESDGAVMLSTWVEQSYIDAVVYGTPSLYYVRRFQDGLDLGEEKMQALGRLLSLSAHKPTARPVFKSYGNWQCLSGDQVMGESLEGQTVILFDGLGQARIFTWQAGPHPVPLHGRALKNIQPALDGLEISNGMVNGNWQAGIIYTCTVE